MNEWNDIENKKPPLGQIEAVDDEGDRYIGEWSDDYFSENTSGCGCCSIPVTIKFWKELCPGPNEDL